MLPETIPHGLRAGVTALAIAAASVALGGCAATSSYAGIPLSPGAANPELQNLARRAQAGDKHAQLELGIRYEEGQDVPVDLKRAEKLYRLAASDSGGVIHVYTPPVGKNRRGRVTAINQGSRRPGLAEAKARLEHLR